MTRDLKSEGALEYRLFLSRFLVFVGQVERDGGEVVQFDLRKEGKDGRQA